MGKRHATSILKQCWRSTSEAAGDLNTGSISWLLCSQLLTRNPDFLGVLTHVAVALARRPFVRHLTAMYNEINAKGAGTLEVVSCASSHLGHWSFAALFEMCVCPPAHDVSCLHRSSYHPIAARKTW